MLSRLFSAVVRWAPYAVCSGSLLACLATVDRAPAQTTINVNDVGTSGPAGGELSVREFRDKFVFPLSDPPEFVNNDGFRGFYTGQIVDGSPMPTNPNVASAENMEFTLRYGGVVPQGTDPNIIYPAGTTLASQNNDISLLRFNLSDLPATLPAGANVTVRLYTTPNWGNTGGTNQNDTGGDITDDWVDRGAVALYGLNPTAPGQDWNEQLTTYSNAPGLNPDSVTQTEIPYVDGRFTQDLDMTQVDRLATTDLLEKTQLVQPDDNNGPLVMIAGSEMDVTSQALSDFIVDARNGGADSVTFLLGLTSFVTEIPETSTNVPDGVTVGAEIMPGDPLFNGTYQGQTYRFMSRENPLVEEQEFEWDHDMDPNTPQQVYFTGPNSGDSNANGEFSSKLIVDLAPPVQPGDFDGDGDVDGADFVVWQTNFPTQENATLATGDADGDGDVDGADFVIWQTNFPFTPSGGAAAVPEPPTIVLIIGLALPTLAALARRRRLAT